MLNSDKVVIHQQSIVFQIIYAMDPVYVHVIQHNFTMEVIAHQNFNIMMLVRKQVIVIIRRI